MNPLLDKIQSGGGANASQVIKTRQKAADDAKYGTDTFGTVSKYADKFLRGTKDVMVGAAKQAGDIFTGVGEIGEKYIMNPLTGGAFKNNTPSGEVLRSTGILEKKNTAQKAGGLLFDVASTFIPSAAVAKFASGVSRAVGVTMKAKGYGGLATNLARKAAGLGTVSVGEGLIGTAYGAATEGDFNKEALEYGAYGAILPVAFAGAGKVLGTAGDLIKFGATKASGLEKETVEQIIKGKVSKEAMEEVNRQSLTRKVGDALLEERNALRDTGQAYNEIRQAGEGVARVEMGGFQDVIDKYKLSVKNGKLVQTADTLPMSDTDLNQINKFFQTYSGDLDANKFLNARQFLAEEAQYDKLLSIKGKSKTGSQLAADLRASLNKQADNFTTGNKTLGKVDAEYAPMKRDLDDVYKKIIDSDGQLKDSAYSVVANLTGDAKTSVLASLKKYIPDIDEQVRVLRAVEDISRTMNTKTGTYIASIFQSGGVLGSVATGNPAFLLTLLANPKFIIPVLRWYGSIVGKSNAFVQAVMRKILGGESLNPAETKFVQETLEKATNKSKKLTTKKAQTGKSSLTQNKKPFEMEAYRFDKGGAGGDVQFFSKNVDYAEEYADVLSKKGVSGEIKRENIKFDNPLMVNVPERDFADPVFEKKFIDRAIKEGNDGVVFISENGEDIFPVKISANKSKKLTTKKAQVLQPKSKTFLQKAGDRIKQEFTAPGYTGTLKPGQKIPDGYSTLKTALKDNRGMQATGMSDDLLSEAKKYKSADDFVKAQGTPLLHGSEKKFKEFDPTKLGMNEKDIPARNAFFFTDSIDTATSYGKNIQERYGNFKKPITIDADGKMYGDMREELRESVLRAKKEGNDVVIVKNMSDRKDWGNYEPATHYAVIDMNAIKTKSQLTEIWNKANPKKLKK